MWFEKYNNNGAWLVYRCSETSQVLVKTFKTEKAADAYIRKHS